MKIWKCNNCGREIEDGKLGGVVRNNALNGKVEKESCCPHCGSIDINPTTKNPKAFIPEEPVAEEEKKEEKPIEKPKATPKKKSVKRKAKNESKE